MYWLLFNKTKHMWVRLRLNWKDGYSPCIHPLTFSIYCKVIPFHFEKDIITPIIRYRESEWCTRNTIVSPVVVFVHSFFHFNCVISGSSVFNDPSSIFQYFSAQPVTHINSMDHSWSRPFLLFRNGKDIWRKKSCLLLHYALTFQECLFTNCHNYKTSNITYTWWIIVKRNSCLLMN